MIHGKSSFFEKACFAVNATIYYNGETAQQLLLFASRLKSLDLHCNDGYASLLVHCPMLEHLTLYNFYVDLNPL